MADPFKNKLVSVVVAWCSGTSRRHARLNNYPHISLMLEAKPFGLGQDELF